MKFSYAMFDLLQLDLLGKPEEDYRWMYYMDESGRCASNGIRVKGHMTSGQRSCSEKRSFCSSFSSTIERSAANDHGCYDA